MTKLASQVRDGQDASDVVADILKSHPEIAEIALFEPPVLPLIQDRSPLHPHERTIVERSRHLRETLGIPFWDAVMLTCIETSPVPYALLDLAIRHNPSTERRIRIQNKNDITSDLRTLASEIRDQQSLAVLSAVTMASGEIKHIPMLDFRCPASVETTPLVVAVAQRLRIPGAVLVSGKSYHFYGYSLLTEEQLLQYLGRALLFAPIVDRSWIAHQLIERCCALRISPRLEYGGAPSVVAVV